MKLLPEVLETHVESCLRGAARVPLILNGVGVTIMFVGIRIYVKAMLNTFKYEDCKCVLWPHGIPNFELTIFEGSGILNS